MRSGRVVRRAPQRHVCLRHLGRAQVDSAGRSRSLGIKPVYGCRTPPRRVCLRGKGPARTRRRAARNSTAPRWRLTWSSVCARAAVRVARHSKTADRRDLKGGKGARCTLLAPATTVDSSVKPAEWVARVRARMEEAVEHGRWSATCRSARSCQEASTPGSAGVHVATATLRFEDHSIGFDGVGGGAFLQRTDHARQVARCLATRSHEILVRPDVGNCCQAVVAQTAIADSARDTYLVSEFARRDGR